MPSRRQGLGSAGENQAAHYLEKRGYSIRERNWHCPYGEIDIVAEKGDWLVFVEVKTRRGAQFGSPEESITPSKRRKLVAAAQTYLQTLGGELPTQWRLDVAIVELSSAGKLQRLEVLENAIPTPEDGF
ncbi:MAG: YraN family protein [Chloroflexi bacterium]|nr:YraN family protein [Chloroflexota bacterium]